MNPTYRSVHTIYRVGIKLKPERTQIPHEIANGLIISERNEYTKRKKNTFFGMPPL